MSSVEYGLKYNTS